MSNKVLLIGYGNPGRLDDGLGPALAEAVGALGLPGVAVDADYQLTVEHAHAVAQHDVVVFADAAVSGKEPFSFSRLKPAETAGPGFTSHGVEPDEVLGLARDLFASRTRGYMLGIRGYRFSEFGERLSEKAQTNLAEAVRFIAGIVTHDLYDDAAEAE
jgi:hydrogenase maturation protease